MHDCGRFAALIVLCLTAASPLAAQADSHREVAAAVGALFDGMRRGDSTAVRGAFHPEARLQTTTVRDGQTLLRTERIDDFLRAVGTPHPEVWDERVSGLEIRVDGPLATAWMQYSFYLGSQFSHCGVNAMQLVRDASGWRILQIIDTRRTTCT